MLLEVKEKEVKEIGCEEIYSGYYNTYLVELNIEEKLKPYLCKIQMACEGTETTEITYVEGQENYLPQAPISGKYAIKIVFYEVIGEELKLRYSLPIFYKWIKQGSYDGEIGRSPKPEEIDEFNKILAQTNKVKQETELIGNKVEQDKQEVEQDKQEVATNKEEVVKKAQEVAQNTQKVQEIANNIEKENIIPKIKDLEENKLNKSGYEADKYLATDSQGNVVTKTIEIKVNEDEYGNSVNLSIDTTTYLMTLQLINKKGVVISTSSIDLPLETMVVNARYDSATKELIIVLQNGTELKVPIASIVNGLVNETTFNNAVKDLQEQITNNNDELNQLVGEVSDNTKEIGLLKTEQATQNNDINAIKTEQTTQNSNINSNTKRISNLEKKPKIEVDTTMSDTSTNAVQNKVIKEYVDNHTPKEEKWELIETIVVGYDKINEKPIDWDTNYQNYFYIDFAFRVMPVPKATYWETTDIYKINSNELPTIIELNKETNGKEYNFKAIKCFAHVLPDLQANQMQLKVTLKNNKTSFANAISVPKFSGQYNQHCCFTIKPQNGYYDVTSAIGVQGVSGKLETIPSNSTFIKANMNINKILMQHWKYVPFGRGENIFIYAIRA